ncbi:aminoglycoside phosphotransferase family protein [Halobacillus naozhouensis]|uniref:Aminoglycoside phosphotransferase family protein n=1 Tax=Halobacillus naozhouensis TaxID=554880 RepID=A0ABY8IYY5_9BACI|nr:aminoglycoside phosphotransferase family protein [Halobacillus naozhouensis]WFT75452.1 aminoglycoside phosphotransferase family protein [Halobacillus naozhouensis]
MELQDKFVENVIFSFRKQGEEWLKALPWLLNYCEKKWDLVMKDPYTLSFNYVAPAVRRDGSEVVVKIGLPGQGFNHELDALQTLNPKGIVQLLDAERERGVFLLEKVKPGTMLATVECEEDVCQIAAMVMKRLVAPAEMEKEFPTTKDREDDLARIYEENPTGFGPFSRKTLRRALNVFANMNTTMPASKLLHGDFHHYNILSDGTGSWIAIDPKGLIGEVEYDLIQFLMNCLPEEGAYEIIANRVKQLSHELNLNVKRLLLWGYAHSVLSSAWTVDVKTGEYNRSFSQCVDIFKHLYEKYFGQSIDDFLGKRAP